MTGLKSAVGSQSLFFLMMKYLDSKVSKEELMVIFKSNIDRGIFISEYPYFGFDENGEFYTNFIEQNINSSKSRLQIDAIELSIATCNFKTSYLDVIEEIIYSGRGWWIKLACLDWLSTFFKEIPEKTFFELNQHSIKSKNEFLQVQSLINLLLLNVDPRLIKMLFKLLSDSKYPAVFYRLLNNFDNDIITSIFRERGIKEIIDIVNLNQGLSESQKLEIVTRLHFIAKDGPAVQLN